MGNHTILCCLYIFTFLLPLFFIAVLYYLIICHLRTIGESLNGRYHQSNVRLLVGLVASYTICLAPYRLIIPVILKTNYLKSINLQSIYDSKHFDCLLPLDFGSIRPTFIKSEFTLVYICHGLNLCELSVEPIFVRVLFAKLS